MSSAPDKRRQLSEKTVARLRGIKSRNKQIALNILLKKQQIALDLEHLNAENKKTIDIALKFILPFSFFGGSNLHRPPANRINTLLQIIYTKKSYERIFMQNICDLREEHAAALADGKYKQARWVEIRGIFGIFATIVVHAIACTGKTVMNMFKQVS
jgi:hypothetical protein